MNSILGILFVFSVWFMVFMFRKSQNQRINESSRYEEHVRDRRETRRRARSRKRYEEQQKNEERLEQNLGKLKGEFLLARSVSKKLMNFKCFYACAA